MHHYTSNADASSGRTSAQNYIPAAWRGIVQQVLQHRQDYSSKIFSRKIVPYLLQQKKWNLAKGEGQNERSGHLVPTGLWDELRALLGLALLHVYRMLGLAV